MKLRPDLFKKLLPLPVTVITTVDRNGAINAAPYSCVMPILRPLDLVTIATALPRHTLHNIRQTGEFVINIIGRPGFKECMYTAKNFPQGVNELDEAGLETTASSHVKPPRIHYALGWLETILVEEISRERYSLVIGRVVCTEINDKYLDGDNLTELPAILQQPYFRTIGTDIICDAEEIGKLFLSPGSLQ